MANLKLVETSEAAPLTEKEFKTMVAAVFGCKEHEEWMTGAWGYFSRKDHKVLIEQRRAECQQLIIHQFKWLRLLDQMEAL